ncbi:hypothetical protein Tco_1255109 [Tanacetum coccineum]
MLVMIIHDLPMMLSHWKKVHTNDYYAMFANETQHSEQPESINDTYLVEKTDRTITLDSSNMCDNERKADQNIDEPDNERVMLASLIANLKLDVNENKIKHKQLKKANTSLSKELEISKQDLFYYISDLEKSVLEINWKNHVKDEWNNPITHDVKLLVKDMLIPLAQDVVANALLFETHLKKEMFEDLKYVQSLEKEVDDLQKDFDDFKSQIENENVSSRVVDLLLQECLTKDILCVTHMSMLDTDNYCDMACKYLYKIN